jgi:N-acetylneuraminic acid mutarotase
MHAYRLTLALSTLAGGLLAGCDREEPTAPAPPSALAAAAAPIGTSNTWTKAASMPSPRESAVAGGTAGSNGIMYLFGGLDVTDNEAVHTFRTVERYVLASDRWTTRASVAPVEALAINGAGLIGGKFYLPGGKENTGNGFLKLRDLQIYTPSSDSWSRGADMPGASAAGVAGVIGGKLYVVTGEDNTYLPDGTPCEDCGLVLTRRLLRYDPQQNRWARKAACPQFHVGGMAGVINGKLYVTGGYGPGGTTENLDIYNPATDSWTGGAALPSVHSLGVGVALGGKLYVIGGFTGEVVAYDPATNKWTRKAPFPVPTARFMAGARVALDGKDYIVVQVGLKDGSADNGRATYVYTP